jgi:hypothetical protein
VISSQNCDTMNFHRQDPFHDACGDGDRRGDISDRDVKRAERLVARHAKQLKEEWAKIHGND